MCLLAKGRTRILRWWFALSIPQIRHRTEEVSPWSEVIITVFNPKKCGQKYLTHIFDALFQWGQDLHGLSQAPSPKGLGWERGWVGNNVLWGLCLIASHSSVPGPSFNTSYFHLCYDQTSVWIVHWVVDFLRARVLFYSSFCFFSIFFSFISEGSLRDKNSANCGLYNDKEIPSFQELMVRPRQTDKTDNVG